MTKRMLSAGLWALNRQYGLRYLYLIPSTLYGPEYHTDGRQMHFIFDLIRKILLARRDGTTAVLWGDGYQRRELVHLDDFVTIATRLADTVDNLVVNVGAGEEFTIRHFAQLICEQTGYDFDRIEFDTSKVCRGEVEMPLRRAAPGAPPRLRDDPAARGDGEHDPLVRGASRRVRPPGEVGRRVTRRPAPGGMRPRFAPRPRWPRAVADPRAVVRPTADRGGPRSRTSDDRRGSSRVLKFIHFFNEIFEYKWIFDGPLTRRSGFADDLARGAPPPAGVSIPPSCPCRVHRRTAEAVRGLSSRDGGDGPAAAPVLRARRPTRGPRARPFPDSLRNGEAMIITQTPLRISFLGGGTDYPEYFEKHGGAVLGTAVNKSAYFSMSHFYSRMFDYSIRIAYRRVECASSIDELEHARSASA